MIDLLRIIAQVIKLVNTLATSQTKSEWRVVKKEEQTFEMSASIKGGKPELEAKFKQVVKSQSKEYEKFVEIGPKNGD